jgi:hypothetical protein
MKCISVARIVDGFIDISDNTRYAEGSEVVIRLISLALVGDPLTGAWDIHINVTESAGTGMMRPSGGQVGDGKIW